MFKNKGRLVKNASCCAIHVYNLKPTSPTAFQTFWSFDEFEQGTPRSIQYGIVFYEDTACSPKRKSFDMYYTYEMEDGFRVRWVVDSISPNYVYWNVFAVDIRFAILPMHLTICPLIFRCLCMPIIV